MTKTDTHLRKNRKIAKQEYVAIEEFIDGKYVKFNSNAGYENQDLSQVMAAFTHWTWERTDRKLMICDLQGKPMLFLYIGDTLRRFSRKFSLDRKRTNRKSNWACARASNASIERKIFCSVLFCPKKVRSSSTFSVCSAQKL